MSKNIEVWPFLVSRNQLLDYRTVVAPDFMCQDQTTGLLARTTEGNLTNHDQAYYRKLYGSKSGELTIIYQVREAQAEYIHEGEQGILKDAFGREIYFIEGIVLRGIQLAVDIAPESLKSNSPQLIDAYRNFWTWESPQSAIQSQKIDLKLSLDYIQIEDYYVGGFPPQQSE